MLRQFNEQTQPKRKTAAKTGNWGDTVRKTSDVPHAKRNPTASSLIGNTRQTRSYRELTNK